MKITIEKVEDDRFDLQLDDCCTGQFRTERGAKQAGARQFGGPTKRLTWRPLPDGRLRADIAHVQRRTRTTA